jgi:hypothetical protein
MRAVAVNFGNKSKVHEMLLPITFGGVLQWWWWWWWWCQTQCTHTFLQFVSIFHSFKILFVNLIPLTDFADHFAIVLVPNCALDIKYWLDLLIWNITAFK